MKYSKSSFRTPTLAAIGLSLSVLMLAPSASAELISYTITFTETSGSVVAPNPTTFGYDASAAAGSQFSAFVLNWDGISYDLTALANSPASVGATCGTDSAAFFLLLSTGAACQDHATGSPRWLGIANARQNGNQFGFYDSNVAGTDSLSVQLNQTGRVGGSNSAQGTWVTDVTPTPEPGSFGLLLVGGALLLARKRQS